MVTITKPPGAQAITERPCSCQRGLCDPERWAVYLGWPHTNGYGVVADLEKH